MHPLEVLTHDHRRDELADSIHASNLDEVDEFDEFLALCQRADDESG